MSRVEQLRSDAEAAKNDLPVALDAVEGHERNVLDVEALMLEAASNEIAAALADIAEAIREHTQVMRVAKR